MNSAYFRDTKPQGTSGTAESTSYVTRPIAGTSGASDLNISNVGGLLTFGTTGIYAIRARCQHFGPSARRFVHRIHVNGTATGLASTPVQTDAISNWTSISFNILSLTAGDTVAIKSKTDTAATTFAGKAASIATEVYTEVEVELLGAANHALFYYSKAANTTGDNELATYSVRDLTSSVNTIVGLSELAGVITFPAGSFRARTVCTHFGASGRKFIHYFGFTNFPSYPAIGNNIGNCLTESLLYITGATTAGFYSKADSVTGTPTMGKQGNLGEVEIYGLVDILKL